MESFFNMVFENLNNVNWEGPAAFIVALMALFAFFRKFTLVLMIILIVVLGWGAQDLIIFNLDSDNSLVSVPFIIYVGGGILVFLMAMYSIFKSD